VVTSREKIRLSYKPDTIKVLFIGESPPANETFFYKADSNLSRHTHEAFSIVYEGKCGWGTDFLRFFKSAGCYLDDLCLEPINKLDKTIRLRKRVDAVPVLAERIKNANPRAIVVVMKGIRENMQGAIDKAGLHQIPSYFLPFPARWKRNQQKYVDGLITILNRLRSTGLLP
jgi:hypothetical protein